MEQHPYIITMNDSLISVKGLSVDYISEGADINAVQNVSFDIYPGEVFGLVGESGSGKSTVVQAMMRILPPPALISGGKVLINDQDIMIASPSDIIGFRWKQISIVMQSALNALNPVLSIREQINDVLVTHGGLTGEDANNRAEELLSLVDLDSQRLDSYPHQLSGGMKQRVVIAIALAIMPPIILLSVLPISFAGWGIREGALVGLLVTLGYPQEAVLLMSILYGLAMFVVSLPGAYCYILPKKQPE